MLGRYWMSHLVVQLGQTLGTRKQRGASDGCLWEGAALFSNKNRVGTHGGLTCHSPLFPYRKLTMLNFWNISSICCLVFLRVTNFKEVILSSYVEKELISSVKGDFEMNLVHNLKSLNLWLWGLSFSIFLWLIEV